VDPLSAVAQPELREIVLFVRAQAGSVTADEVSARFRIHRSVARGRLERLVEAGLLASDFERRTGRSGPGAGRPAKVYSVPPEMSALEFPQRHYAELVGHLLDALPAEDRAPALEQVGKSFAADLVSTAGLAPTRGTRSSARRACAALGGLGFQAAVVEASPDRVVIETPTCPLRPLVVENPEAAAIDRGMWAGLVTSYLPRSRPCSVACHTEGCLDEHKSCRVVIDFEPGNLKTG
jgi:predicted ArsR family transcriptional regulator